MFTSVINHYISLFSDALHCQGAKPAMAELERLSILVHRSMEQSRRVYHTSEHVFDLCQGMNPTQILAALFHDVVYVQLDDGFPNWTSAWLSPLVTIEDGQYVLNDGFEDDVGIRMCEGVFGFVPGQTLSPYGGLNEFLSAVVAVRALSVYLEPEALLPIVLCIEATVPFRGADRNGVSVPDQLQGKAREVVRHLELNVSDALVRNMTEDAIVLANRDIGGFSVQDPGEFLSNTWMLIEESNAPLAKVGLYTLSDYRQALQRMAGFLNSLDFRKIFHPEGEGDAQFLTRQAAAEKNLAFAVRYLNTKLVGVTLVECLAELTGGDAPISMLLGDFRGKDPVKIESFLKTLPDVPCALDPQMLDILENGRRTASKNDTAASPMTAYLYRWLGETGMAAAGHAAQQVFSGQMTALAFLENLPGPPVLEIIQGCANISLSRRDALAALAGQWTS